MEKNTGKKFVTQGILSRLECGHPVVESCNSCARSSGKFSAKRAHPRNIWEYKLFQSEKGQGILKS